MRAPDAAGDVAPATTNRFFAAMPVQDREYLRPLLERVELPIGETVLPAGGPCSSVLFVDQGVLSAIARFDDGKRAEVATIGREGVVGLVALLTGESEPFETIVQVAGHGRRMPAAALAQRAEGSPELRALLLRYAHAHMVQVAQTAACNAVHAVEQRAARWLLMTQDRMGTGFELTQEYLATMLGVRRPTVNAIAQTLQESGAIRYTRGAVMICDRPMLERFVCPCYGVVRAAHERAVPGCFA
ncbi:MAG TPA: Crp/Fnr family transcriptional regulator [Acetobacteraceae bacterium]|nr:Crp/Fnr family transcriptional regulator [Acetobacteraceae bacterium]